jgi:ubiquinone/menaquinone biosynthesis C-methylase UbiE
MSRPSQIRFLSRTARLYDPLVRAMGFSRLWEEAAELAAPSENLPSLDVCTGTGGLALALAQRGARVIGLDLAQGMLERAALKARAAGLDGRARWVRMDACELAFSPASFPLVTCSMALHEMAEEERCQVLREMNRVASDRVVVAEYRIPRGRWRELLFRARRAFEYLESDDFESFAGRDFRARLDSAGLIADVPRDAGSYRIWPCRVRR